MKKLLSFLVVIMLLAVACQQAPARAPTKEAAPAPTEAAAPAPTEEVAAPTRPRALRITFSWPTFIDPAVGNDFSSSTSLANIYDTLVFPNAEAGVDPWLAESWDISDDGLTYTFHLRKGVKFHDGSELLASDVVYSYNRLQTVGEGYAYLITGVESVKAVDDYTVEFKLEHPSGLFVPSLVRLYVANEDLVRENTLAEGPYGDEGDYGKEWLLTHDAGSGPYRVVEFPLEEYLLMEKFNDWWNAGAFKTGCGKTTTMKAILRILPMPPARITDGEIFFKGEDLLKMRDGELRKVRGSGISMIFQDPTAALNPVFTIGQQLIPVIRHASPANRSLSRHDIRQKAIAPLKEVALADPERLLDSYPIQLSGGMRQRVCIGMALATDPELLIADEPGTSLDVTIQDQVLRLLHSLVEKKGTSVILITHTLGVVRQVTDRVYVMYAGNMVEVAPTPKLFANPLHPYTQGLMEAVPRLTGGGITTGIPGRIPSYLNPPSGCRFHTRCPHAMDICRREKPPFFNADADHEVACFLYAPDVDEPEGVAVAS